jgi:hypothetical protein
MLPVANVRIAAIRRDGGVEVDLIVVEALVILSPVAEQQVDEVVNDCLSDVHPSQ